MLDKEVNYVQHYLTRIQWKDNNYSGRIDDNPRNNIDKYNTRWELLYNAR